MIFARKSLHAATVSCATALCMGLALLASCGSNSPFFYEDGVFYTLISDEDDFDLMRSYPEENYYLKNDITLTETFEPIGHTYRPFTGIFNGNGRSINRMRIDMADTSHIGMFTYVGKSGRVDNITVLLDEAVSSSVAGAYHVGALVGKNYGVISRARVTGGKVSGRHYVGAVVGWNKGRVLNSYADTEIVGESNVGGLAGANDGTVQSSYAIGSVSGDTQVGGFVGQNGYYGTVENSYFDAILTLHRAGVGVNNHPDGDSVDLIAYYTVSDLVLRDENDSASRVLQDDFEHWNFSTIWRISGGDWPTLRK